MRKLGTIIFSLAVVCGIFAIQTDRSPRKTYSYQAVNEEVLKSLESEINSLESKLTATTTPRREEKVIKNVKGKSEFTTKIEDTFQWLKNNKVLYRYEFKRSYEELLSDLKNVQVENIDEINKRANEATLRHIAFLKRLKFSPEIIQSFEFRLNELLNPLSLVESRTAVESEVRSDSGVAVTGLKQALKSLTKTKNLELEMHERGISRTGMALLFIGGVFLGMVGFYERRKKTGPVVDESLNGTIKRVLKEIDFPVFICDSNSTIIWKNEVSAALGISPSDVSKMMSEKDDEDIVWLGNRNYKVKVEELKYKSGKVNNLIQMVPQSLTPKILNHIVNSSDVERVLESSFQEDKKFKSLNEIVAENITRMNYLFRVSAKTIDIDFDENLSECFIESRNLDEVVRGFLMASYNLIKDDSNVSGLFVRTSENSQRFSVNCFMPFLKQSSLTEEEASRIFIQKLSVLEAKFSLYFPRITLRWIAEDHVKGLDVSFSLDNKSELEAMMREPHLNV